MQLYRAILWSVCLALAAACSAAADEVVFVPSPSGSLSKTRALLDAADLRVMLPMGYVLRPDLEASGTLASRRGVVESRIYIHGTGAEEGRLEVAIVPGLGGG
ncbi:MAG: hypothetical protein HOC74_26060, partial [Gemmatimonadetes bacterium]|nr:hypothetical protein [Gemmatimonadota bacterium]